MTATLPTPESTRHAVCATCGLPLADGDRFCGACGGQARRAQAAASPTGDTPTDVILRAVAPRRRPAVPFCRACGSDHEAGVAACPACSQPVGVLSPTEAPGLGTMHVLRRKLLKRRAVRIGADGDAVTLLLESGETTRIPHADLPEEAPSPIPDSVPGAGARTPQGGLVRLAEACASGAVKAKWDPATLVDTALAAVSDTGTARAVVLDLAAIGRADLADRLPLTSSERAWVRAVQAAQREEHQAVLAAVAELPAAGYRPKLDLILGAWLGATAAGADLSVLGPHLEAFSDDPAATALLRTLGLTPGSVEATLTSARPLLAETSLPADLAALTAALAGEPVPASVDGACLEGAGRALIAHLAGTAGLVRPQDTDAIPLPLLDDLLEAGAVSPDTALDGVRSPERSIYLRARLAPQRLEHDEVERSGHEAERVRRAFRRGDDDALDPESDEPAVRHFLTLSALRSGKPQRARLEDVLESARPVVGDLLALAAAGREGTPPAELLTDRIVADPTVWPVAVELAGSTGLQPTPELQHRHAAFAEWLALTQARDFLYRGAWREAIGAADHCLTMATLEDVRDEALSLKACGLHHLGLDTLAVEALEQALEGAYSEGLLANTAIVAASLAPEVAATHLGRLMDEAPTVAMRTAAAHQALTIWSCSDTSAWRNSDNSPLPDAFQDALRRLVGDPGLALGDFRSFAALLAVQDSEWFEDAAHIASSPHRNTLEGRFYLARAGNLARMVEIMGSAIAGGSPPPWLLHERDSLRDAAVNILLENLDEPDNTFGSIALEMAKHKVLANPYDDLLVTVLGIAGVSYHLSEHGNEVADHIVQLALQSRARWQTFEPEDRDRLDPLVELAIRRVAINRMLARDRDISQAIDLYNTSLDRGGHAAPGSPVYQQALQNIAAAASVARAARDDLLPWVPLLDHQGVRADIEKSIDLTRDLERRCVQILN